MKLVPYKRIGEPEDIGRAAVWLASDYADYVNGTSLFVDGVVGLLCRACQDANFYKSLDMICVW
jgi:glucose 1-dehydrogenase